MTFLMMLSVILLIYADYTTLYSICDQASDLWQQLELVSELESDLRDTMDWGKKWLVDFNAGKTQLVSFDRSNNNGSIDLKMDGSVLEEEYIYIILWCPPLFTSPHFLLISPMCWSPPPIGK